MIDDGLLLVLLFRTVIVAALCSLNVYCDRCIRGPISPSTVMCKRLGSGCVRLEWDISHLRSSAGYPLLVDALRTMI